ncbi:MerR family transcriptional regulator [Acetobacteraceae bacterium]|nr:MerR family transcriptional regulator [Acetobacteraceae bacterium]
MPIGVLAREAETKAETIRYYEKIGLLPEPPRSEGNYRLYTQKHLNQLRFIRRTRKLGFPIETVRSLLKLSSETHIEHPENVQNLAKKQLEEVEKKLTELKALEKSLKALIKCCPHSKISGCGIIDALNGEVF